MIIQQRHAKIKLINIRSIYFDNHKICRKKIFKSPGFYRYEKGVKVIIIFRNKIISN